MSIRKLIMGFIFALFGKIFNFFNLNINIFGSKIILPIKILLLFFSLPAKLNLIKQSNFCF